MSVKWQIRKKKKHRWAREIPKSSSVVDMMFVLIKFHVIKFYDDKMGVYVYICVILLVCFLLLSNDLTFHFPHSPLITLFDV